MENHEPNPAAEVPSASVRLWVGLCIILSIFIIFAVYSIHQIRWLEDYQINVVQRNRRASIVLLRLQDDAHQLGILLRDMTLKQAEYPIPDWRATFDRLHGDTSNALAVEARYAVGTRETDAKTAELRRELGGFWGIADRAFDLAQQGKEAEARGLLQNSLVGQDAVLVGTVADLLRLNDQAQIDAARRINRVYETFKRNNFILLVILLLLAVATGLYTFQANRKTIERLGHLAERLRAQSEQLRKLSWKLIDVQEDTLRQVARDLHDEFGQILTAIGIMLNRAEQKNAAGAPDSPDSPLSGIQEVKNVVEETLQTVRDRSQMFRPAILDDFGLGKTLEWFTDQFSRQTGVTVHFQGNEIIFPGSEGIHIYRIVQEAL
ncbi:MAG: sensor histidine kinase, partial [Terriglobia bacterium]